MTTGMLGVVEDLQGIGQGSLPQLESIAALPGVGEEDASGVEGNAAESHT
jgi:hypothetical protein